MEQFIRTKGSVNFRTGPGTNYAIVAGLPAGTVVQVLDTVDNITWYKARLDNGLIGYLTSLTQYVETYTPEWLAKAKAVVAYGERYMGVPYVFGSKRTNDTDFDCSDFVQWCFDHAANIDLPWDSRQQSAAGTGIGTDFDVLRTGDLIFFDTNGDGIINHVAIYVAPNRLLHTYKVGIGVTYTSYTEGSYWRNKTTGARRVL